MSGSIREENIIVKKIEGPSVDDEYTLVHVDSYYEEEEPPRSKIKVVLPLIALLVGGGAFYLIQNKEKVEKHKNVLTTSNVETITKASDKTTPIKKTIKEKEVTPKEDKKLSIVVKKSEPKVHTQYIEALAMPTVVEKGKKIETVVKPQIKKVISKKVKVKKVAVVAKPQVKKILVKKRKSTLVAHYKKVKPRIVYVRKGDTLAILAKRFYGNTREYKRIVRANRRIKSVKTSLRLGEKLVIPRKDNKKRRRYIVVEKGNTLAMIAKKFYGDERAISKIVQANYRIKSSRSMLRLGQKVYVPR